MDWKKTLATVAPMIGKAVTVVNPMAGLAIQAASSALLGRPDGSEEEVAAAVASATPDQLLALKQADHQFKIDLERIGVDLEEIAKQDRDSARKREVALGGYSNQVLAVTLIAGFFTVIWAIFNDKSLLTGEAAILVGAIFGQLSAKVDQVVSYFFGSSAGSKQKTDLMTRIVK